MRRASFLVVPLVALVCCAAPAAAAPVDTHSAHLGLRAYRAYLSSLNSRLHVVKQNVDAFVGGISANCPDVLKPVSKAGHASQAATEQFGEEAGADLALSAFAAYRTPLATLTTRIERLRWSNAATGRRIATALDGERQVFGLAPTDLCADAVAFAASGGKSVPPGTKAFVANFDRVAGHADLGALTSTLRRYRPARDRRLVCELNRIELHADERVLTAVIDRVPDLLAELGLV